MGFKQTIVRVKTDPTERAAQIAEIKAAFSEYKNSLDSSNPFKDGQELTFEGIVPVVWSNTSGKSGKYLALSFVGVKHTISLTQFGKEPKGYKNFTPKDDDKDETFSNKGGFAEWLKQQEWDIQIIDDIEAKLKGKTWIVRITEYYIPMGASRKACTLTNLEEAPTEE